MAPDRLNRLTLGLLGLLLLVGGGLAVCYGAGLFGNDRSEQAVFDPTVVRWWNEGGWMSFAVVVAIGAVAAVIGVLLMLAPLRRDDGRTRTPTFAYPSRPGDRGETSLRAAALTHSLEADIETLPDVQHATVGLFGRYPELELRAVIDVGDRADLDLLPDRVEESLVRLAATAGLRPDPVQITVRFKDANTNANWSDDLADVLGCHLIPKAVVASAAGEDLSMGEPTGCTTSRKHRLSWRGGRVPSCGVSGGVRVAREARELATTFTAGFGSPEGKLTRGVSVVVPVS